MHTKKSLAILVVAIFVVFSFVSSIDKASAGLECPINWDDCDCDGTCEMDVSSDPFNCGKCGNVCASRNCVNGSCAPVIGGLIPCGRLFDNPDTTWSEQEDCKICHTILFMNNVIDYLIEIVALIAILVIVIGGMFYISSAGDASKTAIAKTTITKVLYGFVIVFIAWVAVNTSMVLFGFDDPLGDGSWHKFDCELMSGPITNYYCGDGSVDNPNDDGIAEVCDPKELKNDFIARTGLTGEDWVEEIYACDPITCDFGCAGDPLVNEIGEGCYQPNLAGGGLGTACQKGRYICDFNTDTVICQNTFNDISYRLAGDFCGDVYDYCCDDSSAELADGLIGTAPFDIIRATVGDLKAGATGFMALPGPCLGGRYANLTTGLWCGGVPPGGAKAGIGFRCDDVCKNVGKICVGVGLTDPSINSCIYIQHDEGANLNECNNNTSIINLSLPINQASTNCDAWFGMFYYSTIAQHWSTGYDDYEFYCGRESLDNYWHYVNNTPARWNYNVTPNTPGVCRPLAGDTCEFHGFDLVETACYCL